MNPVGWLLGWLYERGLWRWTTGRPWTYQLRDWTRHHPLRVWPIVALIAAAFFAGQVQLAAWFGWKAAAFVAFADFMAYVAGHLWWDTLGTHIKDKEDFTP